MVSKMCLEHKTEIERKFGFDIDTIGVHSWRKCAHTKMNCGSTSGPIAPSACVRSGHSMGKNRDVYIVQEKASDKYCGRILVELPENSAEFAVSYTDFIALDPAQSLIDGVSEEEHERKQALLDIEVDKALDTIFGAGNMSRFSTIRPLRFIGLASHLHHRAAYDNFFIKATHNHRKFFQIFHLSGKPHCSLTQHAFWSSKNT